MKYLKDFIENTPDSISIYDKKLNLLEVNKAGLQLMKMTREQTIGKNIKILSPGIERTGLLKEYKAVIRSGNPFMSDDVSQSKKIGNKQFSVRAFITTEGLTIVTRDITELKNTEQLLLKANQRMEELAYIAAHDMKAPLTNLQSLVQFIRESDGIKDESRLLFDKIVTSIERIRNTVYTLNDVIAMVYEGGDRNTIAERVGTFDDVKTKLEEAPYVKEWDDAKALQADKVKEVGEKKFTDENINDIMSDVQVMTDRANKKGTPDAGKLKRLVARIDKYVRESEAYQSATDVQKKAMEANARAIAGVTQSRAPSRGRIIRCQS